MNRILCCGLVALSSGLAPLAMAQDPQPEPEGGGIELDDPLEKLESWIVLEEEAAPEPPLLRVDVGFVAWIENRSEIRADRNGIPGTRLEDLEQEQGLGSAGVAPWIELSIGRKVRGGADASYFSREGRFQIQDEDVFFDGVHLAQPGDAVRSRLELLTLGGFVEWDVLYGVSYRLGLLGGLRYFRFDADLTGARGRLTPVLDTHRLRGELVSPFFGGLVELTPFSYLAVFSRIQFMNWSWDQVDLKEARFLEFRLGVKVIPIRELALGVEYRFMVLRAEGGSGSKRFEGGLTTNGLAITVNLSF